MRLLLTIQYLGTRYAGWQTPYAQEVLAGKVSLDAVADRTLERNVDLAPLSGRQEYLKNLVNRFC